MRAMLFAAGLGTRLRPLTDHTPKALVQVGGRSLLDITSTRLHKAGVTEMVVNVHHFANQIKDYLATHDLGMHVIVSDESEQLLDTGGGLKSALHLLSFQKPSDPAPSNPASEENEAILIHNVDILSNADLHQFYADHQDADVALMVSERTTNRYLLFDPESMRLMGWTNIATGEVKTPHEHLEVEKCVKLAFSGIHLVNPGRLLPLMEQWPDVFPIMDFYLKHCDTLHIRGVVQKDLRLLDVGKQDTLTTAEEFLQTL